jgi:hypothetical protein
VPAGILVPQIALSSIGSTPVQPVHDPEGELALELGAGGLQQRERSCLPAVGGRLEQGRLADAGRPADQRQAPLPRLGGGERLVDRGEIVGSLDQVHHVGHGGNVPWPGAERCGVAGAARAPDPRTAGGKDPCRRGGAPQKACTASPTAAG